MKNPPKGTFSKSRGNDKVYFDPKTDTFGVKNAAGKPKTMYKPDPAKHGYPTNMDYYNAQ